MFFLFRHAFFEIPRPIALKLCHMIRIWPYFINWLQKFRGGCSPPKLGPKTCKISVNFGPLQTLISNISGIKQHTQNRKDVQTRKIPPAFDEKSPVNFGPLTAWNYMCLDPLKCTFLAYSTSALRGCCALKFLHALEIDQNYLANLRDKRLCEQNITETTMLQVNTHQRHHSQNALSPMVDHTCTRNFLPLLPKLKHKVQQYHGSFDKQLEIN